MREKKKAMKYLGKKNDWDGGDLIPPDITMHYEVTILETGELSLIL